MAPASRHTRGLFRFCQPVALGVAIVFIVSVAIAATMDEPDMLILAAHVPVLLLPSLMFAFAASPTLRRICLWLAAPVVALELLAFGL